MNRLDISNKISKEFLLPADKSDAIVASVFDNIKQALLNHEELHIRGFGAFVIIRRKGHIGRNIHTKKEIIIPDRDVVVFKPSELITKQLNAIENK